MRRLGSYYFLEESIGFGAQGEVWRGHAEGSEEPLAFKLLRREFTRGGSVVDVFLKERDILSRLHSPNVVAIRDIVVERDTLAIVMDYVVGGSLADLINGRGALPPAEVAWLGTGIAAGVAAAHDAGVVHRDLKPVNILMDSATTPSTPRVADFGVARICDANGAAKTTVGMGTPLYMAPEVSEGARPTPAMDIYSLGALLYELTCGVPPFLGPPVQVLRSHMQLAPGRPDGVPQPLWQLISAMLAKDPAARPAIGQVHQALASMTSSLAGIPAAPSLTTPPPGVPVESPAAATMVVSPPTASAASATDAALQGTPGESAVEPMSAEPYAATQPLPDDEAPMAMAPPSVTPAAVPAAPPTAGASKRRPRKALAALIAVLAVVVLAAGGYAVSRVLSDDSGPDQAGQTAGLTAPASTTPSRSAGHSATPSPRASASAATSAPAAKTSPGYLADLPAKSSSFSAASVKIAGTAYAHALTYTSAGSSDGSGEWDLGGGYTQLTGTFGLSDETRDPGASFSLQIFADSTPVATETISRGVSKTITLDLTGVKSLKIVLTPSGGAPGAVAVLGDVKLS